MGKYLARKNSHRLRLFLIKMLLIILPAVCKEKEKGSPSGDPDVCSEHGIAYASLSLAVFLVQSQDSGNNVVVPSKDTETQQEDLTQSFHPSSNVNEKVKIVGFKIGTVAPIRRLIIGTSAPLRVIQDSASLIGDAAIPIVTSIVGGNLLRGLKGSGISLTLVFGIVAVRYVFLPLFGTLMVKGALHLGLVHPDPLYVFVLLLQFALPPAINTGTRMQSFGVGESECSVNMLWTYGLASITVTLWSTFFMWLIAKFILSN